MVLEAARQCNVKQVLVALFRQGLRGHGSPALSRGPPASGPISLRGLEELRGPDHNDVRATPYGVRAALLRCGNLFGGGDLNYSRLIPGVIVATLKGESFLIRSDGKFVRDFLYVEDAADAYLMLAEKLAASLYSPEKPSISGSSFALPCWIWSRRSWH